MDSETLHVHVFDVDGPLYSRDLDEDFAVYLGEHGRFNKQGTELFNRLFADYKEKKIDYFTLCEGAVDAFAQGIKGMSTIQLLTDAHDFVRQNRSLFHEKSVEMLRKLQANPNNKIVLLSTSPNLVISAVSKALGLKIDYMYGASYASREGRFTGKRLTTDVRDYKAAKLNVISRVFKARKNQMTFYGNAATDYESAKRAGVPFVLMNPSQALLDAVAKDFARLRNRKGLKDTFLRRRRPIFTRSVRK